MNKVIFELKDGTTKEFDGEKFTDEQVKAFNGGDCYGLDCQLCPLSQACLGGYKGFCISCVAKCYRVTEEPKTIQILKRLIEGGSVWVDGFEVNVDDLSIDGELCNYELWHEKVTLEKPKKKIKVERWLNVYPNGWVVMHDTKCEADKWSGGIRIACEHFVKEYEL